MSSYPRKFVLFVGSLATLIATTYFVLLGCGGKAGPEVMPEPKSAAMPVTLSPSGARIDDLGGGFSLDSTATAYLDWRTACPEKPTTSNFGTPAQKGGHVVKITYPGMAAPLYGLLALCYLPRDYHGPASRSYQLQIPQSYVDATEGGRVSVVFEPFDFEGSELVAWSLWIARDATVFDTAASPDQQRRLGGSTNMR